MTLPLDRATKLLKILPVWILSPDDVARLFPCVSGLFDVVIVDEASQVDLPSLVPMAYRAEKLVVFGDTKQMHSQRFAFMAGNIARQAWQQFGMERFNRQDLDRMSQSLLNLAAVQADERVRSSTSTSGRYRRSSSSPTTAGMGAVSGS